MKELFIMYSPVVLAFVMMLFNIIKTIKGLNLVDINPPMAKLESKLNKEFTKIDDNFKIQDRYNVLLDSKLKDAEGRAIISEAKVESIELSINEKMEKMQKMLSDLVRADVELKAEIRREKDDSEGV